MANSHVTEVRTAVAAFLAAHLATAVRRVEAAPLRVLHAPAVAAVLRRHCLAHVLTGRTPPAAAACGREEGTDGIHEDGIKIQKFTKHLTLCTLVHLAVKDLQHRI